MLMIKAIKPKKTSYSVDAIMGWANDAVVNNDLGRYPDTLREAMEILETQGLVEFEKNPFYSR